MVQFLAQTNPDLLIFQEAFRGESWFNGIGTPVIWGWAVLIPGMFLAALISWSMIQRDRARFGPTNRRLYVVFGMNAPQRKLLKQLAVAAGLNMPASLLISRGGFERAVKVFAGRYGTTPLLTEIRLKAFGGTSF